MGRSIGLDVHRDFCEIAIADGGRARSAGRVALQLAAVLGAIVHVVSAYGFLQAPSDADAVLAMAITAARAEGLEAVTHARREDPAEALIAVAIEQHADLLVLGSSAISRASWLLPGNVPNKVFQHAPCSILIARTD